MIENVGHGADAHTRAPGDPHPTPPPGRALLLLHLLGHRNVLARNPAAHVRRPRQSDEPSSIALTRAQAVALIAAADTDGLRSAIITRLLLEIGMRVSELCAADAFASTSGHRTLGIVRKGGKVAALPVTPATAHVIDRYLNGRTDGPLLCTSGAKCAGVPQPLDRGYVRDLLRRLAVEAGLPREVCEAMHPHVLKHTVGTLLDEENVPVQEIQRLLGHADPRTTQGYALVQPALSPPYQAPVIVAGQFHGALER
ncbi:tyrosine-type recombinase/integrase [Actinomadura sp. 1N219]|uniref:tyrosine-type recombinase/integrase n=1 Tax=Actinomadura sp. 1N219 TaxID=3375152 RepID=UPI0037ABC05C